MSTCVAQLFEIKESSSGIAASATWMQQQMQAGFPNLIVSESFEDNGSRHLLLVLSGYFYRALNAATFPVQAGQFEVRNDQTALLAFLDQAWETGQLCVMFTDLFDKEGAKILSIGLATPD